MFSRVSVLIPTRHRVNRLQTMLNSFRNTVREDNAELVFRIDDDDEETKAFLNGSLKVVGPRHGGYQSMPLFFNEMASAAHGDVLMCGNDDMVFRTQDWPTLILEAANQLPDGIFDLGVSTLNETHFPFATVSMRVVKHLGFIWDPRIFWGDIFLRDVMAFFGRCVMLSHIQIDHDWAGFRPDKVFAEADKDIVGKDPVYWSVTHLRAVAEAIEKLKELYQ